MKMIWRLKSVPEFKGVKRQFQKEIWLAMYRKVRAVGDCKFTPLLCGAITGIFMLLVFVVLAYLPPLQESVRFVVVIISAGFGGYLGGVVVMSFIYRSGRKYLPEIIPEFDHLR